MAATFSRLTRSLSADKGHGVLWTVLAVGILLVAWAGWFFLARVGVYVVSEAARLEVRQAAQPVESPLVGQVVRSNLIVGREVQVDDLLIELDSTSEQLRLAEQESQRAALAAQLETLHREVASQEQATAESRKAALLALEEARAHHEEAKAAEQYAAEQAAHVTDLLARGNASESEGRLAAAQAAQSAAAAEAARVAVARLEKDQRTREIERRGRLDTLNREVQRLEGAITTAGAVIDRLAYEIGRRRVRSPVAGRVAEAVTLPPGSLVHEGDLLGAIVPPGEVKIVAQFKPGEALGRIGPDQPARLRLDGFPWSQYGSIAATVTRVAGELRHGRVQVELAPAPNPPAAIPLQHGLPGVVEVEVERVSPATLILRIAGQRSAAGEMSREQSPGGSPP